MWNGAPNYNLKGTVTVRSSNLGNFPAPQKQTTSSPIIPDLPTPEKGN